MPAHTITLPDELDGARSVRSFLTEQVRSILEQRSIRLGVVGMLLVVASLFSLIPLRDGIDTGWMFIVPVAIGSIAAGIREGLAAALAAALLGALFATATTGSVDATLIASVALARFVPYAITAAILGSFAEAHYSVQSNLRQLASLDPLTKVHNVTRFYDELGMLELGSTRFAVLVVDVDDLKVLNDHYGHQTGSGAIRAVADVLRNVVRSTDCVARYGGDEFVVILKDADRSGAEVVVNRMREMLAREVLPYAPGAEVTVSVGVAMFGEDGSTSEELLGAADRAMYLDKRARKAA